MSSNAVDNSFTSLLYHFSDENNKVPIYPYITAITGHRRFNELAPKKKSPKDEPSSQEEQPVQSNIPVFSEEVIKEAFKSQLRPLAELWRKSCGKAKAPFILLTGMADGADMLTAEAAWELAKQYPELNIKIVAVLPMPERLFLKTVDDKDRYKDLMEKVSFKFPLPLTKDNKKHVSEMLDKGKKGERRRQKQYAKLGLFLAVHSHVLFALWDGVPPSTQLKGGTADTVFLKLNGITDIDLEDEDSEVQDSEVQDLDVQDLEDEDSEDEDSEDEDSDNPNQGDLLTFSSVGPVIHLLIPRDNDDNRTFELDNVQNMSSIPVLYWTRDKKRKLENALKKQKKEKAKEQAQKQAVSDANAEADQTKPLLESEKDQWFSKCDPLVELSQFNFRNDVLNSDLHCKTAIADQKEIKEVLTKIGALNRFSVHLFRRRSCIMICLYYVWKFICEKIFNNIRKTQINCDSFFKKCKTESYNWLYGIDDKKYDSQLPLNATYVDFPFSDLFGELRPWEDRNTRLLVEHYVVADRMAIRYQYFSEIISNLYLEFFKYLSFIIGALATFWSIRIYGWAKEPESHFHFVWTYFGTENPYALWCLPISAWSFIILSFILVFIYIVAKFLKYHYRYHRFRAVAEALRVQIFWRIAGIRDCVSGYYRSHQIPETEWIRAAVNGLDVFLDRPKKSDFKASRLERIDFVKNSWVSGQRDYFSNTINKRKKAQKGAPAFWTHRYVMYFLAALFFYLQLKGDIARVTFATIHNFIVSLPLSERIVKFIYPPTLTQPNWVIWIFVIIGIVVSFITCMVVYYTMQLKFKRAKSEEKRFEQILFPFDRASLLLNAATPDNGQKLINKQQMILRQLGSEAVSENVNWLLTVGEQDLNLPR